MLACVCRACLHCSWTDLVASLPPPVAPHLELWQLLLTRSALARSCCDRRRCRWRPHCHYHHATATHLELWQLGQRHRHQRQRVVVKARRRRPTDRVRQGLHVHRPPLKHLRRRQDATHQHAACANVLAHFWPSQSRQRGEPARNWMTQERARGRGSGGPAPPLSLPGSLGASREATPGIPGARLPSVGGQRHAGPIFTPEGPDAGGALLPRRNPSRSAPQTRKTAQECTHVRLLQVHLGGVGHTQVGAKRLRCIRVCIACTLVSPTDFLGSQSAVACGPPG